MAAADMEEYTWIVVLGFIAAFFAAFGIGANDVANAFATSVGSKALTVKQACVLAVIFEFAGATFLGGQVVKTIRKGISDVSYFEEDPALLMWGCLCVITCTAIWLLVASRLEMPVSTTHSCVGGMVGMSIAAYGTQSVIWFKETDEFPFTKGFCAVVISWFMSPIFSGFLSALLFITIRSFVMRSKNSFNRAVMIYPLLVWLCITIVSLFMLMKGIKSSKEIKEMDTGVKVGIAAGIGAGVAILGIPLYMIAKNRILTGKFVPPPLAIEVAEQRAAAMAAGTQEEEGKSKTVIDSNGKIEIVEKESAQKRFWNAMGTSLNTDPHAAVGVDAATTVVHENAERFDKNTEAFFVYLQIFSAIFDAFAHGANDVANAVGPFATIYIVYNTGVVSKKADMGDDRYWILGLGGIGIGIGLLLYGYKILRAIGVKLAVITPSRGFCIEMGSSLVVILGAQYGWPLSTTHCQVGATCGVAWLEGQKGVNRWVLFKTAFGWLITCFIVGLMSGLLFALGAYAPSVNRPPIDPIVCPTINGTI